MKKLKKYVWIGNLFCLILGSLSHFFYSWTLSNPIVGIFCPVSESAWEHMKLVFFPVLFYSGILCLLCQKEIPALFSSCLAGVLAGTLFIPVFFYTYTGILGYHLLGLDILTFVLAVLLSFFLLYRLAACLKMQRLLPILLFLTLLFFSAFFLFTFHPPKLGIFSA